MTKLFLHMQLTLISGRKLGRHWLRRCNVQPRVAEKHWQSQCHQTIKSGWNKTALVTLFALAISCGGQPTLAEDITHGDESKQTCEKYGTSVEFADSPAEAAKQATKDEKLVFVLHVSGNFETPDYT